MNKNTIMILGAVAVGGVAYYFWKKSKTTLSTAANAPAANGGLSTLPATGGGTGANASTSSAYNGSLSGLLTSAVDYLKGAGASTGHLPNGSGGATAVPTTAAPTTTVPVNDAPDDSGYDSGVDENGYDADGNYVGL